MKCRTRTFILAAIAVIVFTAGSLWAVPSILSVQGHLKDAATGHVAADGVYDLTLRLYDVPAAGAAIWTETHTFVAIVDGYYNLQLGSIIPLTLDLFDGGGRWLEIEIGGEVLAPRQEITSAGYAFRAAIADSVVGGGGGAGNWTVTDTVLYTNNFVGIARGGAGNGLLGDSMHTHVNLGVVCSTGNGAPYDYYVTIGGGYNNKASTGFSTISGGSDNTASGDSAATIGGGQFNTASGTWSTVSGGSWNTADGELSAICGGGHNTASNNYSTVGGGNNNTAIGQYSAIPGGYADTVSGDYSFAFGQHAVVATNHTARFFSADFPGSLLVGGDVHIAGDLTVGGSYPGGGMTYTEAWDAIAPGADGAWTDVDLSPYGVSEGDICEIVLFVTSSILLVGARTDGSIIDRNVSIDNGSIFTLNVVAGVGGLIELYEETDVDIETYLSGYWH